MFETCGNIILLPLFRATANPIAIKYRNGSVYDSHIIIRIISALVTAIITVVTGNTRLFLSYISPLILIS